jgi:hypothetical protein
MEVNYINNIFFYLKIKVSLFFVLSLLIVNHINQSFEL